MVWKSKFGFANLHLSENRKVKKIHILISIIIKVFPWKLSWYLWTDTDCSIDALFILAENPLILPRRASKASEKWTDYRNKTHSSIQKLLQLLKYSLIRLSSGWRAADRKKKQQQHWLNVNKDIYKQLDLSERE